VRVPELPELEALAQSLDATVTGHEIVAVGVRSPSLLKTYTPPVDELVGDAVSGVHRRGKWLFFGTRAGRTVVVHLMTGGRLRRTDGKTGPARADGMVVRFADGTDLRIAEIGSRKQSAVYFVIGDGSSVVAHLGPEPLAPGFGVNELAVALGAPTRQIKSALVDQRTLAGVGNAWSDEVLHAARLSPLLSTARLTSEQIVALHEALRERLTDGIVRAREDNYLSKAGPDRRTYLRIHNRNGAPCFTCGTTLAAIHHGERQTTYCPACQADGRVYADRRLSRLLR
jgi:formamidopyrimidine-DNA glycosylase